MGFDFDGFEKQFDLFWLVIEGEYQIGENIKPLDPKTVASVVQYGLSEKGLKHQACGNALIYSQLYPFPGMQNYTSGIIHHVRIKGTLISSFLCI